MLEKLNEVNKRYDELSQKLMDPAVTADNNAYKKLMQEYKYLTPIVEKFKEYQAAKNTLTESQDLLNAGGLEPDFKALVEEELAAAHQTAEQTEKELKILLLPHDPNDERNVVVEIRGGAGGEEAALFAYNLFRMYSMYAEAKAGR